MPSGNSAVWGITSIDTLAIKAEGDGDKSLKLQATIVFLNNWERKGLQSPS